MPAPRVGAIVLAAGAGTRFGAAPKQLAAFEGEPLVRRAVRQARDAGAAAIVVVLGAQAALIAPALADLDVHIVMNDAWATGLASSLRAGLDAMATHDVDATLVTTVDQPLVDAVMLAALMATFARGASIVAAGYDGVVGVPVVIARRHFAALAASVTGDRGAGAWLRAQGAAVTTVPLPLAARDVDTLEALHAVQRAVTRVS